MFIRSERLFLRPAWLEDLDDVTRLLCTGPVMSNIDAAGLPHSVEHVREAIVAVAGRRDRALITLPSACGSAVIGGIGLAYGRGDESGAARLGYWLSGQHWGHGYAAEAARGVLAFARAIGLRRVFADQSGDDRASLLALTRAGFRPTGEQRSERGRIAAVYVAELAGNRGDGPEADRACAA